jgi:hypothetical protein
VATREQVQDLLAAGFDYPAVAARLGLSAGEAYLTGTGRPADGSGTAADGDGGRPDHELTSSQCLSNPPADNPTSDPVVRDWMRGRAAAR